MPWAFPPPCLLDGFWFADCYNLKPQAIMGALGGDLVGTLSEESNPPRSKRPTEWSIHLAARLHFLRTCRCQRFYEALFGVDHIANCVAHVFPRSVTFVSTCVFLFPLQGVDLSPNSVYIFNGCTLLDVLTTLLVLVAWGWKNWARSNRCAYHIAWCARSLGV